MFLRFRSSNTFSSRSVRSCPFPFPPLGLHGGEVRVVTAPKLAQGGPKWPEMASNSPRWPPRWHVTAQECSRSLSACLQEASRPLQEEPTWPRNLLRAPPREQHHSKAKRKQFAFAFWRDPLSWAFEASSIKMVQDGPREPQLGPIKAPIRPKSAQRAP